MVKFVYIFLLIFFSIFLQILIGTTGLMIPVTALTIFYITIITDWQIGILTSVVTGSIVDLLYGRVLFFSPILLVIAALLAIMWLHKGTLKNLLFQTIPAAVISFIYIYPELFIPYHMYEQGTYLLIGKLIILSSSVLLSSILFLPYIVLLDRINASLRLNLYSNAQEQLSKE